MRILFSTLLACLISAANAQVDTLAIQSLLDSTKAISYTISAENAPVYGASFAQIDQIVDSLDTPKGKSNVVLLDSLIKTSSEGSMPEVALYGYMRKYLYFNKKANTAEMLSNLKSATSLILHTDGNKVIYDQAAEALAFELKYHGDFQAALSLTEVMLNNKMQDFEAQSELALKEKQEMENAISTLEHEMLKQKEEAEQNQLMMYGVAGVALIVVIVLMVVMMMSKVNKAKKSAGDATGHLKAKTVELEETAGQLNKTKTELKQMTDALKQALDKLNDLNQRNARARAAMKELEAETVTVVGELKINLDELKNQLPVPSFMQMQNGLTRLNSAAKEDLHQIQEHLKA